MNIPTAADGSIATSQKKQIVVAREALPMDKLLEMSTMLSKSTIVPVMYQNRPENCFIAIDMASRMGVSPMLVMQNLYVVQGKPSWSGSACNALIRNCGRFKNVEVVYVGTPNTDTWGAYVKALDNDGKEVRGSTVTIKIAKAEGWYNKNGSKWQTMPEVMLAYRASAWFARVHCPDVMMGLHTVDEVEDYVTVDEDVAEEVINPYDVQNQE